MPIAPDRRAFTACAALLLALASQRAGAQTTFGTVEGGLRGYYRSQRWLPVRVPLVNQGQPTRVEVRAQFLGTGAAPQECRLPERELASSANQVHTLYLKAPFSFSPESLAVDLYREGRLLNRVQPRLQLVDEQDWLVLGVGGPSFAALTPLSAVPGPPRSGPVMRRSFRGASSTSISVALQQPSELPDRWQGIEAADLVVLGNVSERDLTPEQAGALRDYVLAGGSLVIVGGVNWRRLATPFFADLLPVRVTGVRTRSSLPGLGAGLGQEAPSGTAFAVCAAAPGPEARVLARDAGLPLVVEGRRGAGRVVYIAFDPTLPPFSGWSGTARLWRSLIEDRYRGRIIPALAASDGDDPYRAARGYPYGGTEASLATAPYAISQLDIPAFYIVALFLLAYIVVLVPVNYYVLKARDRKEYAWLTTPAIVFIFSLGAYLLGYGFKGGRTLVVRVGVIEAHAGQEAAPALVYAGLFSPRKTGYDLRLADSGQGDTDSTLLSQAGTTRRDAGIRVVQDELQRIQDFAVDMWAMRVLKAESVVRLGRGVTSSVRLRDGRIEGNVRNDTRYSLDDCVLLAGGQVFPLGELPPGGQASPGAGTPAPNQGGLLPGELINRVSGSTEEQRIKRAVLQPLCLSSAAAQMGWSPPEYPLLVGWVREPVARLQVNGRTPREQAATLMVVHLDRGTGE